MAPVVDRSFMDKESLQTSTGAKIKKVLPFGARFVLGFIVVLSASSDKYHDHPQLDKGQDEPVKEQGLTEIEDLEFEFLLRNFDKNIESQTQAGNNLDQVDFQSQKIGPEKAQKIQEYKADLTAIEKKMQLRKDLFTEQDFEDLRMYYPIYQTAAEKYNFSWYLLWIIHQAESTVSRDSTAYEPGKLHYGPIQRAVKVYSKKDVKEATAGFEFLATLPQRHLDDWEEIVWAAAKLRADWDAGGSLLAALYSYSDKEFAEARYQKFLLFSQIFDKK